MGFEPEVVGGLGRFQSEESAADDRAAAGLLGVLNDGVEVLDRAVDEDPALVDALDGRNERSRAGREDNAVVGDIQARFRDDRSTRAIDPPGAVSHVELDSVLAIPLDARYGQLGGIPVVKVGREMDAVVSRPGLLAEGDDAVVAAAVEFNQLLAEAVPDGTVADHHCCLPAPRHGKSLLRMRYPLLRYGY